MSFLKIEHEYLRTPEYIDFFKQIKALVYYFLLAAVIRESEEVKNPHHGAHYIYKEHFLQGRLVSRYSQKKMEKYLKSSQSRISICLEQLEKDGLIKKIIKPTKIGNILYYQFGLWEGDLGKDSYKEILWSDVIFSAHYEAARKERKEQQIQENEQSTLENVFGGDKTAREDYFKNIFGVSYEN